MLLRLSFCREFRIPAPYIFPVLAALLIPVVFPVSDSIGQDFLSSIEYRTKYNIQRINGNVVFDGLSDEAAWEDIEILPFVKHQPDFGSKPSEPMEVKIAYDDEYVYVAGRLYDSEPHRIRGASKERDSSNPNSQWFGFALDTFNDNENAMAFFTTPSGLRWDALINNDSGGNINYNTTWNTFWDVEVVINEKGWFAEFRIPFTSLRFQDFDGKTTMGLICWRSIPRYSEKDIFPAVPPNWTRMSFYKLSEAQDIVFNGIRSRKPLYIVPYMLSGKERSHLLNTAKDEYLSSKDSEFEAGLDIKYGLTSNLTLDLTLNTDFAQVEADDQQINLTRFSLFFPEKRLFFQERSSAFDFNFEDSDRLFHSRRIGIHQGNPVKILGGARIVGRVGDWDVGFLNMQTDKSGAAPASNFGALRLRKQVFNPNSYIGLMNTTKIKDNGTENIAYGLDGIFKLFGEDYLAVKWAQTFDSENNESVLSLDPSRAYVDWERRTVNGLGYKFGLSYSGKEYNPVTGYQNRNDYTLMSSKILYGWFPGNGSIWFHHQIYGHEQVYLDNRTGEPQTVNITSGWKFRTKSGYMYEIAPSFNYENIPEAFPIADNVNVPEGEYRFGNIMASLMTPSAKLIHDVKLNAGTFYDGTRLNASYSPRLSLSSSLEISGTYEYNRISFSDRDRLFNNHIGRLRMLYMYSTKISLSTFVQYNNAVDAVIANSRFRYNPREGIDLYLVYNETFNTDRNNYIPVRPYSKNRTFMLKYSYTIDYRLF